MGIADRVKELRKEREWSQEDLAEAMTQNGFPITQTGISRIERGSDPKPPTLRALARTLEVTVDNLMGPDAEDEPTPSIPDRLDAIDRRLDEALPEATPERVAEARARLRALRESLRDLGLWDGPPEGGRPR